MRSLLLLAAVVGFSSFAAADEKYVTVKGQVKWKGDKAPDLVAIDVKTDKATCCKEGDLLPTNQIVDPKSLGVKYVVVWLRPDDEDRTKTFPQESIKADLKKPKSVAHAIDQPKCQFEPRVLAAREGDTLTFKNSAAIGHNTNYSSDGESFNLTVPAGSEYKLKNPLAVQRTPITFKCDARPIRSAVSFVAERMTIAS